VVFVAELFSSRHKGNKTLRKSNKIKSFGLPAIGFALGEAGGSLWVVANISWFSPRCRLYPPACNPHGLEEAEPEASLSGLGIIS